MFAVHDVWQEAIRGSEREADLCGHQCCSITRNCRKICWNRDFSKFRDSPPGGGQGPQGGPQRHDLLVYSQAS